MYSQKSYTDKLGTCSVTIKSDGCFLTSYANLRILQGEIPLDPPTLNKVFIKNGLYSSGCLFNAPKVAEHFNQSYEKTTIKPKKVCVMETNYYADKGFPQHFVLYNPETDMIIDPLDL